jgi:hypothetical protein
MNNEPKTAAELLALPIRGGITFVERVIDGRNVRVPVAPDLRAFYCAEDTIMGAWDEEGREWKLGKDGEGWFRMRAK